MKHILACMLAMLAAFVQVSSATGLPEKKRTNDPASTQQVSKAQAPEENVGGENKSCPIQGYRSIHTGSDGMYIICALISEDNCIFIPCESMAHGLRTTLGITESPMPGGLQMPAGQNYIGYYDANQVFQLQTVGNLLYEYDSNTQSLTIRLNP